MSAQTRRYRIITPGRTEPITTVVPKTGDRPMRSQHRIVPVRGQKPKPVEAAPEPSRQSGPQLRKYRIITPGRTEFKPPERVTAKPKMVTGAKTGGRMPSERAMFAPKQPARPQPDSAIPQARAEGRIGGGTRTTAARARGARVGTGKIAEHAQMGKTVPKVRLEAKAKPDHAGLSEPERRIMQVLDSGPSNADALAKRIGATRGKIIPVLDSLVARKLVESKQFGAVKRYRLSASGEALLHPKLVSLRLFRPGRGARRRAHARRLTRRQRIRRLDYMIAALIISILILVSYFLFIVYGIFQIYEEDKNLPDGGSNFENDMTPPTIIWLDHVDVIDGPDETLRMNITVFDPGTDPSGVNFKSFKTRFAFATSATRLNPDLSDWTDIVPVSDASASLVYISISKSWAIYNGYYLFVNCAVDDNAGNPAEITFKILIQI